MADPKYTGPSALSEVLDKTDPRVGMIYRNAGFPDLPRYAAQLGGGAAESASLGLLKPPQDPETTPEMMLRNMGHLMGSMFVPLGPVVKTAAKLGVSKVAAGAAANMLATEVQTRGEADASRLLLDGAFGAVFGKFYKPGAERAAAAGGEIIAREAGKDPLRTFMPETGSSKTLRMANEQMLGRQPKEFIPTTYRQMARFHPDPDVREYAKKITRFWDQVPESEINIGDLRDAWRKSLSGESLKDPTTQGPAMAFELKSVMEEAQAKIGETPLRLSRTGLAAPGIRPAKAPMMDVEHYTGGRLRAYSDMFLPATNARQAASQEIAGVANEVNDHLQGVPRSKLESMLTFLKTPSNQRGQVGETLRLSVDDQAKALRVRDSIGKLWERNFGESFDDYLTGILPRLEKASDAQLEVLRNHKVAGKVLEYAANSELNYRIKDLGRFSATHIRSLAFMHHLDPVMQDLSGVMKRGDLPPEFKTYLGDWMRELRGTDSAFAKEFNPKLKKVLGWVGIDAKDADIRNVTGTYMQATYAGLLGFRPGPIIRNITNTLQTGSRIGTKYIWEGYRQFGTQAGRDIARKAGMFEEQAMHEVQALRELGSAGKISRGVMKASDYGLRFYGKVDDVNRSVMYLGMRQKFLDSLARSGKNEDQLLKNAGLYRFHPVIRNRVLSKWQAGDVAGAAHEIGINAAQDTQWVYRSGFRPTAMSGEMQRSMLQFGVWPANYLEYMRQMVAMPDTPRVEKAKWAAEWVLNNAAIAAMFGAAGATVGMGPEALHHTLGWTGLGPLSYTGGPMWDLIKSANGFIPGSTDRAAADARQAAKEVITSPIPGIGLARDIARTEGGQTAPDLIGEGPAGFLGLAPKTAAPESSPEAMFRFMTGAQRRR